MRCCDLAAKTGKHIPDVFEGKGCKYRADFRLEVRFSSVFIKYSGYNFSVPSRILFPEIDVCGMKCFKLQVQPISFKRVLNSNLKIKEFL